MRLTHTLPGLLAAALLAFVFLEPQAAAQSGSAGQAGGASPGTPQGRKTGSNPGQVPGVRQRPTVTVGPPANDDCGAAVPVAVPSSTPGTTVGATIDSSFPTCGTLITTSGVWYALVGTGNTLTASLCDGNTTYDSKLSVYCGTCDGPVCVTGIDDFCGLQSEVSWCSVPGATYLILVHGFGGATGTFELDVSEGGGCAPTVACSLCPDGVGCQLPDQVAWAEADDTDVPTVDTADNFRVQGGGQISSVCWYGGYLDTNTGMGCLDTDDFTITYYNDDGGGFVPGTLRAGPFSGGGLTGFTRTPTGDTIDPGGAALAEYVYSAEHANVDVLNGECLWIEIRNGTAADACVWVWETSGDGDGIHNRFGPRLDDLAFCLDVPFVGGGCQEVLNDLCADSTAITGVGNFPFNLVMATPSPGALGCDMADDVWYCWESVCDGNVTISTCDLTTADTKIAVYNGCSCTGVAGNLLACGDDDCGDQTEVSFTAVEGQSYLIRVGAAPGTPPGVGLFNINCDCPVDTRPQPGSLVVWPEFQAMAGTKTVLTVTSTNCMAFGVPPADDDFQGWQDIDVHMVFRTGENCTAAAYVPPCCEEFNHEFTLTACDTYTLIVDETFLPGMQEGYVYAYAQRQSDGLPITFNHIIADMVIFDGLDASMYRVKPYTFRGLSQPGLPTDAPAPVGVGDGDGNLDLDGTEYEQLTDEYIIPRFLGDRPEAAGIFGIRNELVLVALTGPPTAVTTVRAFLYLDDVPGVDMQRQYRFRCWERFDFGITEADFGGVNQVQFDATQARHAGWARVDGDLLSPPGQPDILDPGFVMLFVERQFNVADTKVLESSSRPFEICDRQDNGNNLSYP